MNSMDLKVQPAERDDAPFMVPLVNDAAGGMPPRPLAQPAGWGDLLAGRIAALVLWRHPSGPGSARLVVLVGLANFASAFFFGLTNSALPIQLFAFDIPNRVMEYPTGFIPVFLVPYAVLMPILSLGQMWRGARATQAPGRDMRSPAPI